MQFRCFLWIGAQTNLDLPYALSLHMKYMVYKPSDNSQRNILNCQYHCLDLRRPHSACHPRPCRFQRLSSDALLSVTQIRLSLMASPLFPPLKPTRRVLKPQRKPPFPAEGEYGFAVGARAWEPIRLQRWHFAGTCIGIFVIRYHL